MFGGKHPLSKVNGQQIKDITNNELRKECIELYRPPGIIKNQETALNIKPNINEFILNTIPTTKLYRRTKPEEKKDDKYERPGPGMSQIGGGMNPNLLGATLNDQRKGNDN